MSVARSDALPAESRSPAAPASPLQRHHLVWRPGRWSCLGLVAWPMLAGGGWMAPAEASPDRGVLVAAAQPEAERPVGGGEGATIEDPAEAGIIPSPLRLDRVVLSTGGVGLFEYAARVTGPAVVTLTVRTDQVDDLLKSLTLADPAGRPRQIRLPGPRPAAEAFRDLPLTPADLEGPAPLLAALKGARVTITGPRRLSGRVLAVTEESVLPATGSGDAGGQGGGPVPALRHRLTLLTDEGLLRQAIVEEAEEIVLDDPAWVRTVDRALSALAVGQDPQSRTLAITLAAPPAAAGQGNPRVVRAAHVAEVPLWKASYRLILPPEDADGAANEDKAVSTDGPVARLSAWATVENLSGQDWRDVSVTMVSGNPVTFRQDLFSPYRVARPVVPVEVHGRLLPPPDGGSQPGAEMSSTNSAAAFGDEATASPTAEAKTLPPGGPPAALRARLAAPMPAMAPAPGGGWEAEGDSVAGGFAEPGAEPEMVEDRSPAAETTDLAAQVLFTLPDPVSLSRGETLTVPLVDQTVPATRVAHILPPGVMAGAGPGPGSGPGAGNDPTGRHPLAALRLTNTTPTALPPGAVSLTQQTPQGLAYLGDARLGTLAPGEHRLLAFAVDQDIVVDRDTHEDRRLAGLAAARGVLTLRHLRRAETVYTLTNRGSEARLILIDHPRRAGWDLIPPEGLVDAPELTAEAHRLSLVLDPGKTTRLSVVLEHPDALRIAAGDLDDQTLAALTTEGRVSEAQRRAAEALAQRVARVREYQRHADQLTRERDEVLESQDQVRDNLASVPRDSDLHDRFMDRLDKLDERLVSLETQITEARAEATQAQQELEAYVATLSLP